MKDSVPIWVVVLAAGRSLRMGRTKLTLPLEDGTPMIRHVVQVALGVTSVSGVALVHRPSLLEVWNSVQDLSVHSVPTGEEDPSMGYSMQEAVRFLQSVRASAAVFLVGDEPDVQSDWIERVVSAHRQTGAKMVQTQFLGRRGHPVLFHADFFPALSAVVGDEGGRSVLRRYVHLVEYVRVDEQPPVDLDTPEDYQRYLLRSTSSQRP
ncbi:MAG: nucleotidyltransferase family protein [Alicyclobacillaceae bacterium]|jgi:molybdenum cofactor cytidylyltransferase|uniref:nucleotidyltransferase family protein n=1 Tax=Alicyclobacillus sp. SP_1 TaxID=2942475 RepID=UPI002158412A|nr:nucleotidyltransferase family protein [Alicyclobacillus sp. SP_1]MCY0888880.1 nucleotidyltransferase family protein [Alicyclobacillaceae bacterium]